MKTPQASSAEQLPPLQFYGGLPGTLAPFFLYLMGVAWLALSGAPDERGFWPIILAAMTLGLLLATDRTTYCEVLIKGMSQPITSIMIMAWLLAGVLGSLMSASGFVEALVWLARHIGLSGEWIRRRSLPNQCRRFDFDGYFLWSDLPLRAFTLSCRRRIGCEPSSAHWSNHWRRDLR